MFLTFDITGELSALPQVLDLAYTEVTRPHAHEKRLKERGAVGWTVEPDVDGLMAISFVQYVSERPTTIHEFPSPLTAAEILPMITKWLNEQDYGDPPRTADSQRGFRARTTSYDYSLIVTVRPFWIAISK